MAHNIIIDFNIIPNFMANKLAVGCDISENFDDFDADFKYFDHKIHHNYKTAHNSAYLY